MKLTSMITAVLLACAAPVLAEEGITISDLASIDLNGDGVISQAEYVTYMDRAFKRLDVNGNGALSAKELSTILTPEQIAGMDMNRNGRVNRSEFNRRVMADFQAADRNVSGGLD